MDVKKTKKLSGQTSTTTVVAAEKFVKVDGNDKVTLIDLPNLRASILGGLDLDCMMDNVFIMYHNRAANWPLAVKPHKWPALQSNGEIADGVMIVEGGKVLVVAPTDSGAAGLPWSSAAVNGGATTTLDHVTAINDWNGRENTAAIISNSSSAAVTDTAAYAPGFCNLYSRVNANGRGLTAGKWWLPSVGELLMMEAHRAKISYCLSLINGATPLLTGINLYLTSTEGSDAEEWRIYMGECNIGTVSKTAKGIVRPVSTFIK